MNYLRIDLVYFTLSDLIAALTFVVMLINKRLAPRPFGQETSNWYTGVALFLFGLTLGSVIRGDPTTGIVALAQYTFSLVILPMIILNRPHKEIVFLIKVFVFSMVFVMLHGAYYVNFVPDDSTFISGNGRLNGLVERENAAGALGAVAFVFCQWLYISRNLSLIVFLLSAAAIAYGVLLTGSNTGFFLAGIGVLTLGLFSGSLRTFFAVIFVGGLVVLIVLQWGEYFLPEIFVRRVFGAITTGNINQAGTFEDRLSLTREALSIARDTLWIGLGVDQHRIVSVYEAPVHNTYLLSLTEGGLMSLLGLVYLIVIALFIGWRAYQLNARLSGALTLTYVTLFALSLNGFTHIYARFWAIPFLLALAISVQLPGRAGNPGRNTRGNSARSTA